MPKVAKKKGPRRKLTSEKENDAMSAEQINIITPNGPNFEQTIDKNHDSLDMSEGQAFVAGVQGKTVRITLTPREQRSASEAAKTPRVRNILPMNMFNNE